jgi:hypothetical protein
MPISVQLSTSDGHAIAEVAPLHPTLNSLLKGLDPAEYPYLALVDPYTDTTFTPLQMSAVLPELRRLSEAHEALDEVLALAERCAAATHEFLVFVGD